MSIGYHYDYCYNFYNRASTDQGKFFIHSAIDLIFTKQLPYAGVWSLLSSNGKKVNKKERVSTIMGLSLLEDTITP